MANKTKLLGKKDFCYVMNCSPPTADKWEKEGMPVIRSGNQRPLYDLAACQEWFRVGYFNSLPPKRQASILNSFGNLSKRRD